MRYTSHSTWKDFLIEWLEDLKLLSKQRKTTRIKYPNFENFGVWVLLFLAGVTHKTNAQVTCQVDDANGYKYLGS